MTNKEKRPTWYKMTDNLLVFLDAFDGDTIKRSLAYSRAYMKTGEIPQDESPLVRAVFGVLQGAVDTAIEDVNAASEVGRNAANARWHPENGV